MTGQALSAGSAVLRLVQERRTLQLVEAFESFVVLALESEQFVVSEAVKFPVQPQAPSGLQTHGYEVDLVGARADRLVLASVKSYFGSRGVAADHVLGEASSPALNTRCALFNNKDVRTTVVEGLATRLLCGRPGGAAAVRRQVRLQERRSRERIREWCEHQVVGRARSR